MYVTACDLEKSFSFDNTVENLKLEMWANAQRDGRPAEYM